MSDKKIEFGIKSRQGVKQNFQMKIIKENNFKKDFLNTPAKTLLQDKKYVELKLSVFLYIFEGQTSFFSIFL